MATRFLIESNSVNNFERGPPKEHSCQVWSKLAQVFGRRRCLKKLLTTYHGHRTTLKAPPEHAVLGRAKNLYCRHVKTRACLGKRVHLSKEEHLTLHHTIQTFTDPENNAFFKICSNDGKYL